MNCSFKEIKKLLFEFSKAKYRVEVFFKKNKIDIYHFNFCTPSNIFEIFFLQKRAKTIFTFWGSDLMRVNGAENVYLMTRALKKVTVITVQTPEMAEMLYCKYGRDLKKKLRY